ncbi:hypothetical protein [Craterilacuibacter sp. RT1T]|uniref:hypothetical protein n=1 Tax=Craterilacuibacter sp. RT1T TaxID=2942211 RepID=UPI0020BD6E35|nr:hypothetical protein [Craterilacuibacter sp. RT1T]MCL6262757.1 hypothetical protein [Craterilacuibacter sp. RT1T]
MELSSWLPIIGWTIPAMGWYVANKQANERELRKEVRSEVEDVIELVDKILESLKEYLALDGSNDKALGLALEIRYLFKRLDTLIHILTERERYSFDEFTTTKLLNMNEVVIESSKFFELCTGGDFGDIDKQSLEANDLVSTWLRASLPAHELINKLHGQFITAFK